MKASRFCRLIADPAKPFSGSVACPCCGYPTLGERSLCEICTVCWWEDDGQDDHDADRCSACNHGYTLIDARSQFEDHGDMYKIGKDRIAVVSNPSVKRITLLNFVASVSADPLIFEEDEFNKLEHAVAGES